MQRTVKWSILGRHEEDVRAVWDRVRPEQIREGQIGPARPQSQAPSEGVVP